MKDPKLEKAVTRIMRICKGWGPKEEAEDRREYPDAHEHERKRIRAILRRFAKESL